jgi:hypothetical protein
MEVHHDILPHEIKNSSDKPFCSPPVSRHETALGNYGRKSCFATHDA